MLVGLVLMAAFVVASFAVVLRYAGGWGVPYFSFTTERGSSCTNDLTGYTCDQLTLADVEFYGDVDLPDSTKIITGRYRATHDFSLDTRVEMSKADAAAGLKSLRKAYGKCQEDHPSPLPATGLTGLCVMANDDAVIGSDEAAGQLFTVGTGVRKNGVRVAVLSVKSR